MMNEANEPSWLQTIFSPKTYKSTGCFNIKFPGLALAWLIITASIVVRIIFLPPLIHNAADISELKTDLQHNQIKNNSRSFSFSSVLFVICGWTIRSSESKIFIKLFISILPTMNLFRFGRISL